MDKKYTEKEYNAYMKTINDYIKNAEKVINELPKFKKKWKEVSKLSFEDWVKWQKGEYKINQNE